MYMYTCVCLLTLLRLEKRADLRCAWCHAVSARRKNTTSFLSGAARSYTCAYTFLYMYKGMFVCSLLRPPRMGVYMYIYVCVVYFRWPLGSVLCAPALRRMLPLARRKMPLQYADPNGRATQFWAGTDEFGKPNGTMRVYAVGTTQELFRPCVDCGLYTGKYCEYCLASERIPRETWAKGQRTPLCSTCDREHDCCHFCRGVHLALPFPIGDGNLVFNGPAVPHNQPDAEPAPDEKGTSR